MDLSLSGKPDGNKSPWPRSDRKCFMLAVGQVLFRSKDPEMRHLVPIPKEWAAYLKRQRETGLGYQVISVNLKDGRRFDQVVASEGCVIQVRGYSEVPFQEDEVESVQMNNRPWNFRVADSAAPIEGGNQNGKRI